MMADSSKPLSQVVSDLAKSLPQVRATVDKPIRERREQQRKEKLMTLLINRRGFQDKMNKKIQKALLHEMTCGDLSHMHGGAYTYWKADDPVSDLASTDNQSQVEGESHE